MTTTEGKWLSFLGQGVRHLVADIFRFSCGLERQGNTWWEPDDEGPACQSCVRAQMRTT